ncbi:phosphoglucomutase (alpha-D-glucose-1,6-bisphosphate-dependent) [Thermomonas sp.]|uniref:phosphoglucomutase (alpha-D-glucose-1,6-bisphosphate-dependent) n=1 Tax=Thermomonas sp. TaxID=1971895 RepID=UPI00248927B7|nr:phosphoglucomutase (alpha-D-glucose-1,6-bisphosphate-dependent) [Thermomonas sp.]MDI1253379.1 phosphoglucomutase (alpha-D-glucose-1,6-bisphosphate-dependent) [Thermomonas sp.]
MATQVSPLAGKPAQAAQLVDVDKLVAAYFDIKPDPSVPVQRVAFGTSGHRGSSFDGSFNEHHVLAITQAICEYRKAQGIDGPLFLGIDTHALSGPARDSALEVLAANGVEVRIAIGDEYTPTPAVSHGILVYNQGRTSGLADGIVVTPSHNPPDNGGFKYNPVNGGPADTAITRQVQDRANVLLEAHLDGVSRVPLQRARSAATTREHDFLGHYIADLGNVLDFDLIRSSGIHMGVDPLGGAGVHYWARIAEHYRLNLEVVSEQVDPTFAFMTLDWDGKIRMDPSSSYAMQRLIGLKDRFDVAFACDTDHDRHGVVTKAGLLPSNHYLAAMIDDLFNNRPQWNAKAAVGKTVVSSSMIDRVAKRLGRKLYETPVGFKWFADGLFDGSLGFGGEESAGASFLRRDGTVWTTDKDGLVPALFAAELTARHGHDPAEHYRGLCDAFGEVFLDRVEAPASPQQKQVLAKLSPDQIKADKLAGAVISKVLDKAPGNNASIGGIKVVADNGWFAARPSGTEDIYKIYGESFESREHLRAILTEAQGIVDAALAQAPNHEAS